MVTICLWKVVSGRLTKDRSDAVISCLARPVPCARHTSLLSSQVIASESRASRTPGRAHLRRRILLVGARQCDDLI